MESNGQVITTVNKSSAPGGSTLFSVASVTMSCAASRATTSYGEGLVLTSCGEMEETIRFSLVTILMIQLLRLMLQACLLSFQG